MPLLSDIYQYVFAGHAAIDDSKFPQEKKAALRGKIEKLIREKFQTIINSPRQRQFRKLLRKLNNASLECILFGNAEETLDNTIYDFPSDEEIRGKFRSLNAHYRYFTQKKSARAEQDYLIYFKASKITADFVENNNNAFDQLAGLNAYKMLVLFGLDGGNPFASINAYLHNYNFNQASQPVHDALLKEIPVNTNGIDLARWRKLALRHGPAAVSLFQVAPDIHRMLKRAPETLDEAKNAASQIKYQRYNEYPELAELCYTWHVNENNFNKCLDHVEPKRKKTDNLPDVVINGAEHHHPGYYLVKLPANDPHVYVLGHLTNCCMNPGGNSYHCIVDGVTKENCGFYVLLRARGNRANANPFLDKDKINHNDYVIVGCGYAWLGQMDSLTLDSWENLRPETDDPVIVTLLKIMSKQVINGKTIKRVHIGTGGKTPKEFSSLTHPDIMMEGIQCSDSYKQALIHGQDDNPDESMRLKQIILEKHKTGYLSTLIDWQTFNKLVSMDACTPAYLKWLNTLFFSIDSEELWGKLLHDNVESFDQLTACAKDQGPEFIELLLQIHAMGLLDRFSYRLILENAAHSMSLRAILSAFRHVNITLSDRLLFIQILQLLKNENALTQVGLLASRLYDNNSLDYPRLNLLFDNLTLLPVINNLLEQLQEADALNKRILLSLVGHVHKIHQIAAIMLLLKLSDALDKDNVELVIKSVSDHPDDLQQIWAECSPSLRGGLADKEMFRLMMLNAAHILETGDIIKLLQHAGLLTHDNLLVTLEATSLNPAATGSIREAFTILEDIKVLNPEIVRFIAAHPAQAKDIMQGLWRLFNNKLYTYNNCSIIFASPSHALDIADALIRLHRNNLLDDKSRQIIRLHPGHADSFSCGLNDLYTAASQHQAKDVFRHFIEYYKNQATFNNPAQIVQDWVENYQRTFRRHPFADIAGASQAQAGPGLFQPAVKDFRKIFNTFMAGHEIPEALAHETLVSGPSPGT